MRYFGDKSSEGDKVFNQDVNKAITTKGFVRKGPVWQDFVSAMNQSQTSKHTSIITATLQSPQTILGSLKNLQNKFYIKNLPLLENIWSVSNPEFETIFKKIFNLDPPAGGGENPSARKAAVMENILDRINKVKIPASAQKVLSSSGKGKVLSHLWGFSDDDFGNFSKAVEVLQANVDKNRWPNVLS